jgi:hypothetical protein
LKHAIDVAVVTGAAHVIYDFIATVFDQRIADLGRERVKHFVPGGALPLSFAARADSFEWKENALRIMKLVDGCRTLGAVASSRAGMERVSFELLDLAGFLIDVSKQPASSFAIETRGWYERVVPLDFLGPAPGVVLCPVIPAIWGRIA